MKRDSKLNYYKEYFEANKNKMSSIWKGIRSIVNINNSSKKEIKLIDNKGRKITDPLKIAEQFNNHYDNVCPNIDKKIPKAIKNYRDHLKKNCEKYFFLSPVNTCEFFYILSFDNKKSI